MPREKELWRYYHQVHNDPLELCFQPCVIMISIPTIPLLSLPHCTNFNILSKNVVCRDYPFVSSVYCVSKEETKSNSNYP